MTIPSGDLVPNDFVDHLVSVGLLEAISAARVRSAGQMARTSLERTILELGLVEESELFRSLAHYLGLIFFDLVDVEVGLPEKLGLDLGFLERVSFVPVKIAEDKVVFATPKIDHGSAANSVAFYLSTKVEVGICTPSAAMGHLSKQQSVKVEDIGASISDIERLRILANDGPIIKFVNDLIARAVVARASDIHIESEKTGARIRFRIDGILDFDSLLSSDRLSAITSRLKVMANLNIAEKRRPQDGRFTTPVQGRDVDVRLSTIPTQFGESVVLRLLDPARVNLSWDNLGFDATRVLQLKSIMKEPHGIFLVAGPTGSGKTTTLYTAIKEVDADERKIVTVEDPIEYSLPSINQTQVNPSIDMTFAQALRAILRQDPDVVLVGEIRDAETAEIAVRAALIGRLVISTIHTNDSLSAVARLRDLGVPPYLLASTLRGVLSQRLVRRVCTSCSGRGCDECGATGREGRQIVSEFLGVSDAVRAAIACDDIEKVKVAAEKEGLFSLRKDALRLIEAGLIDPANVEVI